MKTLILASAIFGLSFSLQAQTYIQGGVSLANITSTTSGQTEDNNVLTTFNAGILSRFDLSKTIDLESGLLLSGRGSKAESYFTSSTTDNYTRSKFNPLYIEVPLNLVFRLPIESNSSLFIYGGPYASMGIAGKSKTESSIAGIKSNSESDIQFSNDDPFTSQQEDASYNKLKRFDFGLNAGAGIDLGKVILKANYGYGLVKINSTEGSNNADDKNKFRTISFSLGLPLGR